MGYAFIFFRSTMDATLYLAAIVIALCVAYLRLFARKR